MCYLGHLWWKQVAGAGHHQNAQKKEEKAEKNWKKKSKKEQKIKGALEL